GRPYATRSVPRPRPPGFIRTRSAALRGRGPDLRSSARRGGSLRRDRDLRKLQLRSAARADGVVDLRHPSASRTTPAQLIALEAVGDRGQQAEERDQPGDEKPQQERAALDLAYQPAREAEAECDDHIRHRSRLTSEENAIGPDDAHHGEDHNN